MNNKRKRPFEPVTLSRLLDNEIKTIKDGKEIVSISCKNGIIKDLHSVGNDERPEIVLDDAFIKKMCKNSKASIIHTHGLTSGLPSTTDLKSYDELFNTIKSVDKSCSIGIDGIFCVDKYKKKTSFNFEPNTQDLLIGIAKIKKWEGDSIFCDKIAREKYYCTMENERDTGQQIIGIFDDISVTGGVSWLGTKDADFLMFSPDNDKKIECFGSENNIRRLTCLLKGTIHEFSNQRRKDQRSIFRR